jgi:hypothetical protein
MPRVVTAAWAAGSGYTRAPWHATRPADRAEPVCGLVTTAPQLSVTAVRGVASVLISLLIAIALAVLVAPQALDLAVRTVLSRTDPWSAPQDPWAVLLGLVVGVAWMSWRRPSWFWHTWVHEHAHLAACLVLGVRIRALAASDGRGGSLDYDAVDPVRGSLIALAPYVVPLALLPLLLLQEALPAGPWRQAASGLATVACGTHLHGLWHNIRLNSTGPESDLVRVGRPLAAVVILIALLLLMTAVFAVLWDDPLRRLAAALWL